MYLLLSDRCVQPILQLLKDCTKYIILVWRLATVLFMVCPQAQKILNSVNKSGRLEGQLEHHRRTKNISEDFKVSGGCKDNVFT